jgi:serine phosphatase RsbU (regulator of sigma subunit)
VVSLDLSIPDSRFARTVADLLDAAQNVEPDKLAGLISTAAAALGASACQIWLVDHQQRILVPLAPADDVEPAAVDRTIAGRAFANCAVLEVPGEAGAVHLWLPLINGVDRIGVLEIDAEDLTPKAREAFRHLASITTSEIIARGQYTDAFTAARRCQTMDLGAELQWQVLPPTSFATRDVSVTGMLEPAYHIGGDTFDYAYNGGGLHVGLFDAVGHGLVSSLLSTLALGAYRNRRRSGVDLGAISAGIDDAITEHTRADDYVTGQLAHLDVTTGTLRWLNAGHPLPLLIRQGRAVGSMSCSPHMPFGLGHLLPERMATIAEVQLEPDDAVLMYTDGIIEARGPGGSDFGLERLVDFMDRAFAAGLAPGETLRRLSHAVLDFHSGSLKDDATTVLVSWHPVR